MTAGASGTYYFHYIATGGRDGGGGFLSIDENDRVKNYPPQYLATQVIAKEWVQPVDAILRGFDDKAILAQPLLQIGGCLFLIFYDQDSHVVCWQSRESLTTSALESSPWESRRRDQPNRWADKANGSGETAYRGLIVSIGNPPQPDEKVTNL